MKNETNQEFYLIDILKYLFCACVVGLHTSLFIEMPKVTYYYIEKCILRLGVPFFFVTSGFFLAKKYNKVKSIKVFKDYTKRLLLPLLVFEGIGFVMNFYTQFFVEKSNIDIIIKGFIKSFIFYPQNALWFLQALIVGSWIAYVFIRKNQKWLGFSISGILYLFSLLGNSYFFVIKGTFFEIIMNSYTNICVSTRNGLFVGFFFIMLGFLFYDIYLNNKSKRKSIVYLIIVYVSYVIEVIICRDKSSFDDGSLFVLTPLVSVGIIWLASYYTSSNSKTKVLRNLSTGVYLIHRPLLNVLIVFSEIINMSFVGSFRFLATFTLANLICIVLYKTDWFISKLLK